MMLRRLFSTSTRRLGGATPIKTDNIETVELAYDLWEPRKGADPSKNPIVFLHGLFGSRSNNRTVSKIIARDLNKKIYCPDLRNHGDSPHNPRHDYFAMAADLRRFVQEHELAKPIIIGHSMGARVVMAAALLYPDIKWSAVIPVDNGPVTKPLGSEFRRYIQGMKFIDSQDCKTQKEMFEKMEPYVPDVGVRQFLLSNFKHHKHRGAYHCRLPLDTLSKSLDNIGDFDYFATAGLQCTAPTLLIRGTQSNFVPDESLPLMGQLFPKFVVRDIDSGHWVISEKPQEFVEDVEDFLTRLRD